MNSYSFNPTLLISFYALLLVLLVGAIGLVGSFTYEDELRDRDFYCQMVEEGYWKPYDLSIQCQTQHS